MPLKLEEKRDVTDHDQKVDDFLNGADLHRLFKRKLAKIQPFIFITKQFVSVKWVKVIHWFCSAHLLLHITIWPPLKRACLGVLAFPSYKNSHFKKEAKCETFLVKMSFICIWIKSHFHINDFSPSIALKLNFGATRIWPILRVSMGLIVRSQTAKNLTVSRRKS